MRLGSAAVAKLKDVIKKTANPVRITQVIVFLYDLNN